jgi:hypothetical protein
VRPQDYRWVAEADRRQSYYLPINNAFHTLREVKFVNRRNKERKIPPRPKWSDPRRPYSPYSHVPLYLQNLSRLAPGSEQFLETLARQVKHGRTLFLSYARKESRAYAA